ncbi:MAG: TlpA disulfide reductase family protein [Bacteroidota bacterium]
MKKILLLILVLSSAGIFAQKTASLKGTLKNFSRDIYLEDNSATGALLSTKYLLGKVGTKDFTYTLNLEKPGYYKIGKNYLFISPGDNIECALDFSDRMAATFKGSAIDANQYLALLPMQNGGSFLDNGKWMKNIQGKAAFDSIQNKKARLANKLLELKKKKSITESFYQNESSRLTFEMLNSLMNFTPYYGYINQGMDPALISTITVKADSIFEKTVNSGLNNISGEANMELEIFRQVMSYFSDTNFSNKYKHAPFTADQNDYFAAAGFLQELQYNGVNGENVKSHDELVTKIKNKTYVDAIEKAYGEYKIILPGASAADLLMKNKDGKEFKLTQFQGKITMIDFWATWCRPCLQEAPYFDSLRTKIGEEKVNFISLSTDRDKKAWLDYMNKHDKKGIQLHVEGQDLVALYKLYYIPRFVLIGKDGKIIDAFAPRPSDPKLEKLIRESMK